MSQSAAVSRTWDMYGFIRSMMAFICVEEMIKRKAIYKGYP